VIYILAELVLKAKYKLCSIKFCDSHSTTATMTPQQGSYITSTRYSSSVSFSNQRKAQKIDTFIALEEKACLSL
jgi:hypothetical protein